MSTFQDIYLRLDEGEDGVLLLEGTGRLIVERALIRDDADLEFHSLVTTEINMTSIVR
jgi:hypothetical protein